MISHIPEIPMKRPALLRPLCVFFLATLASSALAGTLSLTVSEIESPIEVLSFKVGAVNVGSASTGGGAGAGKVLYSDFSFKATESAASPLLLKFTSQGKHLASARLTVMSSDGARVISEWQLQNVLVTSVTVESGAEDTKAKVPASFMTPVTSFTLAFGTICYRVFALNGAVAKETCWNLAENTGS